MDGCMLCVWITRNEIIFNGTVGDLEEIMFKVMMFTWWWLVIGSKESLKYNFYE